ncbi:hypothetical protein H5410_018543 [Solanum commersonii]|uniref:MADS-box domain-containing protein n=1 Tax=Solanum commersonii TaxID=4109 RepID=A0A9J6A3P0_SOLCO|nr:hypothetical protein H5410_018543 [Solanum commersonii]
MKTEATFKMEMANLVKKSRKHSSITGEQAVILAYSPNGKQFFYDSSKNSHKIDRSLLQKVKKVVAAKDDLKAVNAKDDLKAYADN